MLLSFLRRIRSLINHTISGASGQKQLRYRVGILAVLGIAAAAVVQNGSHSIPTEPRSVFETLFSDQSALSSDEYPASAAVRRSDASAKALAASAGATEYFADLPVADVTTKSAPDAWGTVIFLPQYHRLPGSSVNDPRNDKGVTTQHETYAILKKLHADHALDLIMVEGELVGPVSSDKRRRAEEHKRQHEKLNQAYANFTSAVGGKQLDRKEHKLTKQIQSAVTSQLKELERSIALMGAPYMIWTEYPELHIVGSENENTRNESAAIVRDRIYLEDRLSAVTSAGRVKGTLNNSAQIEQLITINPENLERIKKLMNARSGASARLPGTAMAQLKNSAEKQGSTKLLSALTELEAAWPQPAATSKTPTASAANLPTRSDNPYGNISDANELNRMLKANEKKIRTTIIDVRNRETAENMTSAMKSRGEVVGVLQFGAGHETGLVDELVKQGLTVVTVTPDTVAAGKARGELK